MKRMTVPFAALAFTIGLSPAMAGGGAHSRNHFIAVDGILSVEPGPHTLSPGEVALIDDKSCPRGQIKQVIGGDTMRNRVREKSCVTQP